MTTVDIGPDTGRETSRDRHRAELAELLGIEAGRLHDSARLNGDLGLDSLAKMSLQTWLAGKVGSTGGADSQPGTVGEVLALLEEARDEVADRPATGAGLTVAAPADPAPAPVLHNSEVRLCVVEPDDLRFLYTLATHPQTCYRWRYRGNPPPIDRFAADLWKKVLVQFVVRRADNGEPIGHVMAYGADLGDGYAYLGAVFQPRYTGTGLAAKATAMFIRYLFHIQPLRKIYLELPEFNWEQISSGEGKYFRVEGVLRDHEHYAGRHWDRYICAIYADEARNLEP